MLHTGSVAGASGRIIVQQKNTDYFLEMNININVYGIVTMILVKKHIIIYSLFYDSLYFTLH